MFNPIFKENVQRRKHPESCTFTEPELLSYGKAKHGVQNENTAYSYPFAFFAKRGIFSMGVRIREVKKKKSFFRPTSATFWKKVNSFHVHVSAFFHHCIVIVRRAGLLWSQQDFKWRWSVPLFKCLTVLEFSCILFDLCLLITFFNFIMNYVPIVTFWIFTYHKIWILSIMFCFRWSYWIIYFLACLEVSWRVVS